MAEKKERRSRTIPIWDDKLSWWLDALERHRIGKGWQAQLARDLKVRESDITRMFKRERLTFELAIAISDRFKLPYPAFLPESEAEAWEMMERRTQAQQAAAHRKSEEEVLRLRRLLADLGGELMHQASQVPAPPPKRRRRAG